MNAKLKKILIIITVILVIALIGLLVYNFFIKKPVTQEGAGELLPESEEGEEFEPEQETVTPQPEMKIKVISEIGVIAPTLTKEENGVIYYSRSNGKIWKSDWDGSNLIKVSDTILEGLVNSLWSPNKEKVISIFQSSVGKISKYFYNFNTGKAVPLDKYIKYTTWSPDSNKIAYQYYNEYTDNNSINIANPDGSNYQAILRTRIKDLIVEWPKGSEIFLREKPSGLVQSSLYSVNSLSKTFNKVVSDIYGFSLKWSLDGSKILYSKTDSEGKNITIFTAERNGSNQKNINISTLAEKCTWSQDPRIIYCAIPKNINEAELLPDDFYKGTFSADDEFWEINIETQEKNKLLNESQTPDEKYDAINLFLSPDESYLFFVNKADGKLYSVELD